MPKFIGMDNGKIINQGDVKLNKNIKISHIHMGGISQDMKRHNMWDFYPSFFGFS